MGAGADEELTQWMGLRLLVQLRDSRTDAASVLPASGVSEVAIPVTTCGAKVYVCRVCSQYEHPDRAWSAFCTNDAGRKACFFCDDNQGDLDLIDAPSEEQ